LIGVANARECSQITMSHLQSSSALEIA
jgi:hypothetical protein